MNALHTRATTGGRNREGWLRKHSRKTQQRNQFMKNSFVNVRICGCKNSCSNARGFLDWCSKANDLISGAGGKDARQTYRVNQIDLFMDGAYNWDITRKTRGWMLRQTRVIPQSQIPKIEFSPSSRLENNIASERKPYAPCFRRRFCCF